MSNVVDLATQLTTQHIPYSWGGTNPYGGGVDCSGLVQWLYKQAGINIPRTSQEQFAALPPVPLGPSGSPLMYAQPGDLVFFGPMSGPTHVGLVYSTSGNGTMINALHSGTNVEFDNIKNIGPITGIRRVDPNLAAGSNVSTPATIPTATLTSSSNGCLASVPLLGCVFSKGQGKAVLGASEMAAGIGVAALGIWLLMGSPGKREAGWLAKLAILA